MSEVNPKRREVKKVRLRDNPFLASLTDKGMTYQGESPDKVITVVAVVGNSDDWAAYYETPWSLKDDEGVAESGNKLPESVARELFPEWGKGLKYRL